MAEVDEIKHKEIYVNTTSFILEVDKLSKSNLLQCNKIISGDPVEFNKYIYPLFCRDGNVSDIHINDLSELLKVQHLLNKYEIELDDDECEILYEKINFSQIIKNVRELVFEKKIHQYLLIVPRVLKNYKNKKIKEMLMEYVKKNFRNNGIDYDNFNYNTIKNYVKQNNILRLIKLNFKYNCIVLQLLKYIEDVYKVNLSIYVNKKDENLEQLLKSLKKK
jgi:flagellar biosynthesis component FlhA